jgi:hypothetical protein
MGDRLGTRVVAGSNARYCYYRSGTGAPDVLPFEGRVVSSLVRQ